MCVFHVNNYTGAHVLKLNTLLLPQYVDSLLVPLAGKLLSETRHEALFGDESLASSSVADTENDSELKLQNLQHLSHMLCFRSSFVICQTIF